MHQIVLTALLPVVLLIAAGFALARLGWIKPVLVKPLSTLAFMVLTPVLLFRTMSRVHVEQLEALPAIAYMSTLALAFCGMFWWRGLNRSAAVLALAVTYSNAVMIGIPLVSLAWGEAGLVTLFTLIPVHSLVLLTVATMALEIVMAHENTAHAQGAGTRALRCSNACRRPRRAPWPRYGPSAARILSPRPRRKRWSLPRSSKRKRASRRSGRWSPAFIPIGCARA